MYYVSNTAQCNNPPNVSNANIDNPDPLEEGANATYTCTTRYVLVGDKQLTCKNGKWTGVVPSCQGMCAVYNIHSMTMCVVHSLWHVIPSTTLLERTSYTITQLST